MAGFNVITEDLQRSIASAICQLQAEAPAAHDLAQGFHLDVQ
jgi:hypothetical protein